VSAQNFVTAQMGNAKASLEAAGLPDYLIYTGGIMPGMQRFSPGNTGLTYIPIGSASQWWTSSGFIRR